jgi:spermidine/putrescine-binding protein
MIAGIFSAAAAAAKRNVNVNNWGEYIDLDLN